MDNFTYEKELAKLEGEFIDDLRQRTSIHKQDNATSSEKLSDEFPFENYVMNNPAILYTKSKEQRTKDFSSLMTPPYTEQQVRRQKFVDNFEDRPATPIKRFSPDIVNEAHSEKQLKPLLQLNIPAEETKPIDKNDVIFKLEAEYRDKINIVQQELELVKLQQREVSDMRMNIEKIVEMEVTKVKRSLLSEKENEIRSLKEELDFWKRKDEQRNSNSNSSIDSEKFSAALEKEFENVVRQLTEKYEEEIKNLQLKLSIKSKGEPEGVNYKKEGEVEFENRLAKELKLQKEALLIEKDHDIMLLKEKNSKELTDKITTLKAYYEKTFKKELDEREIIWGKQQAAYNEEKQKILEEKNRLLQEQKKCFDNSLEKIFIDFANEKKEIVQSLRDKFKTELSGFMKNTKERFQSIVTEHVQQARSILEKKHQQEKNKFQTIINDLEFEKETQKELFNKLKQKYTESLRKMRQEFEIRKSELEEQIADNLRYKYESK